MELFDVLLFWNWSFYTNFYAQAFLLSVVESA